ncbi:MULTISPECIES: peptidase U32 family protein [Bifidobacterium]|uniref:peptidase U32 family protein n=1 Tax=Bifidobacterium TaxID=1678 RepID=UPI001BDC3C85|nr:MULTISPECIES: U32 family peptidase [Bifidobacterium]MBT1161454.1 U32 family peptidase [Bifidobacterium sp. SO1]MBW3078979.1 U32 family peptidase [Bifidobacterium simiiventris]
MPRRHKPEVLAPAGNLRGLKTAVDFGADAVYCGGKAFGMRSAPKNLSLADFEEGARYAHERGARVYVTLNVLPRNAEVEAMREYIGQLKDTGIDAMIVTDIGVMMMAHQIAPDVELHVSTQAGVTNYGAAQALYEFGARRVVLAREMDLQAVRDIRARIPDDMDIECFVHGAMCMAFSGRCLFSNYLTGRDGNHGECAQPCRWKYSIVEEKRPGQYFPIEQTSEGAYLFNSQDMCMLDHIDDLIDSGATSLKIEGRSKSAYYIAAMTNAYKIAVNEYMVQRGFEDASGAVLKPFRDRVVRPDDPDFTEVADDAIERNADKAFAGMPGGDMGLEFGGNADEAGENANNAPAVEDAAARAAGGSQLDDLSYRARSARRKSNTAEEVLPEGWHHARVRPAEPVKLPDWLLEEPDKVAHRDYSTGFYYPEHKVSQNTDRSAYFRAWMVVGEVLDWTPDEGGRVTLMSRNKIEAGQEIEFLLPGERPFAYTVPAGGFRDADGHWVESINNPAHVFSMPCPHPVPHNAAIRSRTKKPTLKAE